jgi:hypothetical protein
VWFWLAALAVAASSCSDGDQEIPTLAETSQSPNVSSQEMADVVAKHNAAADAMAACLEENAIPFEEPVMNVTGYGETEFRSVLPNSWEEPFAVNIPGVGGAASEGVEFDDAEVVLIMGGVDHSDLLAQCIDQSGYFVPGPVFDRAEEGEVKRVEADAANDWAACARDNGLVAVEDAKYQIDNFETAPAATVPASTSLELFQAVLAECPPIDPDTDFSLGNFGDIGEEPPSAVFTHPRIEFDPPDDPNAAKLAQALAERINALYEEGRRSD